MPCMTQSSRFKYMCSMCGTAVLLRTQSLLALEDIICDWIDRDLDSDTDSFCHVACGMNGECLSCVLDAVPFWDKM